MLIHVHQLTNAHILAYAQRHLHAVPFLSLIPFFCPIYAVYLLLLLYLNLLFCHKHGPSFPPSLPHILTFPPFNILTFSFLLFSILCCILSALPIIQLFNVHSSFFQLPAWSVYGTAQLYPVVRGVHCHGLCISDSKLH